MKRTKISRRKRLAGPALAAILAAWSGSAPAQGRASAMPEIDASSAGDTAERIIEQWPKDVQALAKDLIERYGPPAAADANELAWNDNGPWRKTILRREGFSRSATGKARDYLKQVVAYQVPGNKISELKRFDERIEVNQVPDELAFRSESESTNYLALNLADDIIKGQRTARAARAFYVKTKILEKAGKSSPYLDGLMFALRKAEASGPNQ